MNLSKNEIRELPTILDVMDILAARENIRKNANPTNLHPWKAFEIGYYIPVSMGAGSATIRYIPSGPCYATFYRGQNCHFDKCIPSFYRIDSLEKMIVARLLVHEFQLLVLSHPIINELICRTVSVNLEALAQHYGFATNMMDVSNDKWTAAFFACTKCDKGNYSPVDENYGDGFGVIYVSTPDPQLGESDLETLLFRTDSIGFHFFPRPTSQSAYGFLMNKGENFDKNPFFEKILFRHDKKASQWVFETSYRQKKYFPYDSLTDVANRILQNKRVSQNALERFCSYECKCLSKNDVISICRKEGVQITAETDYKFPEDDLRKDLEQWYAFGRKEFLSRIVSVPMIAHAPVE